MPQKIDELPKYEEEQEVDQLLGNNKEAIIEMKRLLAIGPILKSPKYQVIIRESVEFSKEKANEADCFNRLS